MWTSQQRRFHEKTSSISWKLLVNSRVHAILKNILYIDNNNSWSQNIKVFTTFYIYRKDVCSIFYNVNYIFYYIFANVIIKTSTSISNNLKTNFLQSISFLFDMNENFASKSFTQLVAFSQQSSNTLKSSFSQSISLNSTSIKSCLELVTQSTLKFTIEEIIKTSKSKICINDIKFFDFTTLLNFFKLHFFNINVSFFHNVDIVTQYKKQNILNVLIKCLRDSTYVWFKTQLDFISLNNFKEV